MKRQDALLPAAAFCILLAAGAAPPAGAEPLSVAFEAAHISRGGRACTGLLEWRGGLRLSSGDPRFGGFSGLMLGRDGRRMLAVSDRGWWWRGRLAYDERGRLSGLAGSGRLSPLLSSRGARLRGSWRDAEALAPYDGRRLSGPVLVGFERKERLALYDWGARGGKATARYIPLPPGVSLGRRNGELEAAARFWAGPRRGWFIAAGEKNFDERGDIRAWLWKGRRILPFSIVRRGLFRVTDIAVLPDGSGFLTLERRFSRRMTALPAFAIRLFAVRALGGRRRLAGQTLLQAAWPFCHIDNMEGLAIHQRPDGELRLSVISDDNHNPGLQSTLLFQFALPRKVLQGLSGPPGR